MSVWDDIENSSAAPSRGGSMWDTIDDGTIPEPPKRKREWYEPSELMNSGADLVGGISNSVDRMGLNSEQFFAPARRANEQQRGLDPMHYAATKVAAGTSGAFGLADSIGNFATYPIQQMARVAPEDRFIFNMQKDFDNQAGNKKLHDANPEMYDQYKDMTTMLAPIPGKTSEALGMLAKILPEGVQSERILAMAAKMSESGVKRILDSILTQGTIGAGQAIGDAAKKHEDINPLSVGIGAAAGALGGAAFGGFEELIGKLAGRGAAQAVPEILDQPNVDMDSRLGDMVANGHIDMSDPEFAGMDGLLGSLGGGGSRAEKKAAEQAIFAQQIREAEQALKERQMQEALDAERNAPAPMVVSPIDLAPPHKPFVPPPAAPRPFIDRNINQSYLDLSQAPRSEVEQMRGRMNNLTPRSEAAPPVRQVASPMDLAPPQPAAGPVAKSARQTADEKFALAIQAIENARPDTILAAQEAAKKAMPRGASPEFRKPYDELVTKKLAEAQQRHIEEARVSQEVDNKMALQGNVEQADLPLYSDPAHREIESKMFPKALSAVEYPQQHGTGADQAKYHEPIPVSPWELDDPQLQGFIRQAEIEQRLTRTNSKTTRDKWKNFGEVMSQEAQRREVRRVKGLPIHDDPSVPTMEQLSDDDLHRIISNGQPEQSLKAADVIFSREANPQIEAPTAEPLPVETPPPVVPIQGEARTMRIQDENGKAATGHDVAEYAKPVSEIEDPVLRSAVEKMALTQIARKEAEYVFDNFGERLYEKLGGSLDGKDLQIGPYTIPAPKKIRELNLAGRAEEGKLRDELSDHYVNGFLGEGYTTTPGVQPAAYAKVPPLGATIEENAKILAVLQNRRSETLKEYERATDVLKALNPGAGLSHKVGITVNGEDITVKVHYRQESDARKFLWDEFAAKQKRNPSLDPKEYFAERFAEDAAALKTDASSIEAFIARLQRNSDGFHSALKQIYDNPAFAYDRKVTKVGAPGGTGFKGAAKKAAAEGIKVPPVQAAVRPVLGFGGILLMSDGAAMADDGSGEQHRNDVEMRAGFALAAAAIGGPALGKLLKTKIGKGMVMYADALDHVMKVDDILGNKANARLSNMILDATTQATQLSFGVHFDSQNEKARALSELIEGLISPEMAFRNPPKGSAFAAMNQQQKQAVIGYYAIRKTLAKKVKGYVDSIEGYLNNARVPQADRDKLAQALGVGVKSYGGVGPELNNSLVVLKNLARDMQGGSHIPEGGERVVSTLSGNSMDFFFLWNPAHQLLNLGDSIISGSSRVGPLNMLKANLNMMNGDMRKIMKDANLFGSFKQDRAQLGSLGEGPTVLHGKLEDPFHSDEFNANRVALGAWHQFYQLNKDAMSKAGFRDSNQFVKAMASNSNAVPANVKGEAWNHMIEAQMRILGVDPLRANPNWIRRQKTGDLSVMKFANQPVRMARMLHEYVNKGQWDKIGVFMVLTTVIGGDAVIPQSVQLAGQYMAPEETARLKRIAHSMSIPGFVSDHVPGAASYLPELSGKLGYDPLVPMGFGAPAMVAGAAINGVQKGFEAVAAAGAGDKDKALKSGYKALKTGAQMGTGGPIGEMFRLGEAAKKSVDGKETIYNFPPFLGGTQPIGDPYTLEYNKVASGGLYPILDALLPGDMVDTYRHKQSQAERHYAKGRKKPAYFFDHKFGQ